MTDTPVSSSSRGEKNSCVLLPVGNGAGGAMTSKCAGSATCRWQAGGSIWNTSVGASNCSGCGGVHVEHLDWLANNSRYTQRFATHVGKLCRDMPNKAVAEMERLHHGTVKALDTLYMQEQVDRAGLPAPRAIGVDEISIRKGHNYRVIVSDLERARPIWVGGEGRKETDIDLFFKALGGKKSARIKLAAMDMWKPFRNSVIHNAPNARIIFDKFHIMRHLSKALDEVRRGEYKRLSGKDRSYIKGQRYTLLSRRENLSLDGRRALKKLLQANRRLNTAYILKEAFGQLWDYRTERGARAFFHPLERQPQMATPASVPEVRRYD